MELWNRGQFSSLVKAVVMAAVGAGIFLGGAPAGNYRGAPLNVSLQQPEETVPETVTAEEESAGTEETGTEAVTADENAEQETSEAESKAEETAAEETTAEELKPWEQGPRVRRFNLATMFPEGADTSDPLNSLGGKAFKRLYERDNDWNSSVFGASSRKPEQVASQIGRSRSSLLGKYNITDDKHDPDDPSTWVVGKWNHIRVDIRNGDGKSVPEVSNVKQILAMASVYTYYHDPGDEKAFIQYAEDLWRRSHSSSISMGQVYYDTDCLSKEAVEKAMKKGNRTKKETTEAESSTAFGDGVSEAGAAENAAGAGNAADAGNAGNTDYASRIEAVAGGILSVGGAEETPAAEIGPGAALMTEETAPEAAGPALEAAETLSSETLPAETLAPEALSAETMSAEALSAAPADPAMYSAADPAVLAAMDPAYTGPGLTATPGDAVREEGAYAAVTSGSGAAGNASQDAAAAGTSGVSMSGVQGAEQTKALGADAEAVKAESEDAAANLGNDIGYDNIEEYQECPGHVDLTVKVTISTMDGEKNLFKIDRTGNAESSRNGRWNGWTSKTMKEARELAEADWYADYGLSVSLFSKTSPLTETEVEEQMALLPTGLSRKRLDLARTALESIGKIPYYWGGKAVSPDYDKNNFFTVIPADYKGRVFRGLDCSGWLGWVYWHTTGKKLGAEGTAGQIHLGRGIRRKDLNTGDIIIRAGTEETIGHVLMFLRWNDDGRAVCIHETGGVTNNVCMTLNSDTGASCRNLAD